MTSLLRDYKLFGDILSIGSIRVYSYFGLSSVDGRHKTKEFC